MKKILFITFVILLNSAIFAHNFEYRVIKDNFGYPNYGETKIKIKKGTILHLKNTTDVIYGNIINGKPFTYSYDSDNYDKVSLEYLELTNNSAKLDENLITYNADGIIRKAIPSYYLDVLYSKDKYKLEDYEILNELENIETIASLLEVNSYFFAVISNIGIELNNSDEIAFQNVRKLSESEYECKSVIFSGNPYGIYEDFRWHSIMTNTPEGETEIITLTIDGDYLRIFNKTTNSPIITLTYVNDSVMTELKYLFKNDTCDLSKVTWPRHANGSCDYDDSSSKKQAIVLPTSSTTIASTNVTLNKTMTVSENLKLRSGEATSTQVLTVMQAGTKVKILELGKAETIDGISSNWVKVEVQTGAKDRDGKPIKAGTVGWCYGGYLK